MALLEDSLLNERNAGYCSSSSDEEQEKSEKPLADRSIANYTANTGPKGVLEDWRRFKQLQSEMANEKSREMSTFAHRLSMTCRTWADDEKAKLDAELKGEKDDDDFLERFRTRRRDELAVRMNSRSISNRVVQLTNSDDFLRVTNESPYILVHLYEPDTPGCAAVDGCFNHLAPLYTCVQFCRVRASDLGTSANFSLNGVPALQAYKNGTLVGNFVRLHDQLGVDFYAHQLETYLRRLGIILWLFPPLPVQYFSFGLLTTVDSVQDIP